MTRKKAGAAAEPAAEQVAEPKECFIIMPIADRDGYESGHFDRVYEWIIKPACELAGYEPVRADDVNKSHFIVADILKRIVEAPMAICDISSLNANVMFELGIRQAYGKPVALIKDEKTRSVFDISGLRYSEYSSTLRADLVKANVDKLASMLSETGGDGAGMTSLMSLVQIDAATMPQAVDVSADSQLILRQINTLSRKVDRLSGERAPLESELGASFYEDILKKSSSKSFKVLLLDRYRERLLKKGYSWEDIAGKSLDELQFMEGDIPDEVNND